jgi:hypothetical protein
MTDFITSKDCDLLPLCGFDNYNFSNGKTIYILKGLGGEYNLNAVKIR